MHLTSIGFDPSSDQRLAAVRRPERLPVFRDSDGKGFLICLFSPYDQALLPTSRPDNERPSTPPLRMLADLPASGLPDGGTEERIALPWTCKTLHAPSASVGAASPTSGNRFPHPRPRTALAKRSTRHARDRQTVVSRKPKSRLRLRPRPQRRLAEIPTFDSPTAKSVEQFIGARAPVQDSNPTGRTAERRGRARFCGSVQTALVFCPVRNCSRPDPAPWSNQRGGARRGPERCHRSSTRSHANARKTKASLQAGLLGPGAFADSQAASPRTTRQPDPAAPVTLSPQFAWSGRFQLSEP